MNFQRPGQRRRCQLLELLATPRPIYLLDEITSDLDLFAREGVLQFIKAEAEIMGATVTDDRKGMALLPVTVVQLG